MAMQMEWLQVSHMLRPTSGRRGPHPNGCQAKHPELTHPHLEDPSVGTVAEKATYGVIALTRMGECDRISRQREMVLVRSSRDPYLPHTGHPTPPNQNQAMSHPNEGPLTRNGSVSILDHPEPTQ